MNSEQQYSLLDFHFANFLVRRSGLNGEERERFQQLIISLSSSLAGGHSCLPITDEVRELLRKTPLASEGLETPLVTSGNLLYLQKYFGYESRLASQLRNLAEMRVEAKLTEKSFQKYFDDATHKEVNWQRKAAELALNKKLCIVSGGPGTGKTTTVVKIISLLIEELGDDISIALAAPTGKAAMRLKESIVASFSYLNLSEKLIETIPTESKTLHRLLGVQRNSVHFRHNQKNPLSYDVVVVDEASMVDLAMMSKLVDALRPDCHLILLGDKDQLASVESGAVLADCILGLPDNTVLLQKSFRFDENIKDFSVAIIENDGVKAWEILSNSEIENIQLSSDSVEKIAGERYLRYMRSVKEQQNAKIGPDLFNEFLSFQILSGVRKGPAGVENINRIIELYLTKNGFDCLSEDWYLGRPVMITRNDYNLGLFNGDVGICLRDLEDGRLKVWFENDDGKYRGLPTHRLPQCETVYAMTIHKSQGSEFQDVMVVLPDEDNRVLSRELIYTAVTRAKNSVQLKSSQEVFLTSLARKVTRNSGLAIFLQKTS